jgi:hypothetical protein
VTTYIKAHVNVSNPETHQVITLIPGDVLPEWAEGIITNPDVIQEFDGEPETPDAGEAAPDAPSGEEPPAPVDTPPAGDDSKPADDKPLDGPTRVELEKKAKAHKFNITAETTDAELAAFVASKE